MRLNNLVLSLACSVSLWGDWKIIDTSDSHKLTKDALIQRIGENRNILLGEQHRNTEHHRLRGTLIASFPSDMTVVVAEHLDFGRTILWKELLINDLKAGGFSDKGWKWPIHQDLFEPLKTHSIELIGGNISRDKAKDVVLKGPDILEPSIKSIYDATPYGERESAILIEDIRVGHCNTLPENMLKPMASAQHAKDSAMSLTLHQSKKPIRFLIAGNGHVRKDYGVPVILKKLYPEEKTLSIGFIDESDYRDDSLSEYRNEYDVIVVAGTSPEEDHCVALKSNIAK